MELPSSGGLTPELRLGYIDVIKGLVVAGVIVAHAAMTYGLFGNWPYQEVVHPLPETLGYGVAFVTMLGMGLLFLVAGLFTPAAIQDKGRASFLLDRCVRLGIPAVLYLVVVMPGVNFLGHWASGSSPAAATAYALDHLRRFDLGPMWFVFALLAVTVGWLGWEASRPRTAEVGGRVLLVLAVLSTAATFLVRTVQPVSDGAPLNVAGWPPDFILFALGALAGSGWLARVPARTLRYATALVISGMVTLMPLALFPPSGLANLLGGWHWESAVVSVSESLVTIGLTIWIVRLFQRLPRDPLPLITRGSFTAYLVQTPAILLLGIAMRPLALAPELKAVILAILALVACFGVAAAYRGWIRAPLPRQAGHAGDLAWRRSAHPARFGR